MRRSFLGVTLCVLLAGCTQAYSRCVVVQTAAPEAAVEEAPAPPTDDTAPPTDDAPDAPTRPADIVSANRWAPSTQAAAPPSPTLTRGRTWSTHYAGAELTEAERRACCKRNRLVRARKKSNLLYAGVMGGIVAYGFIFFDYGSSAYQVKDDGWFEEDNKDGGSDKTGHALAAHIQTAVWSGVNRSFGIPRKEAALRGAVTAFSTLALMELGDGFSEEFGTSWTDLVANTAGCVFGYFHETSPRFNRLFDYRWEYWPSDTFGDDGSYEPTTDIEGSAFVLAINMGALYSRNSSVFDYLDFQVGYLSRHYKDHSAPTERRPFVGVGINLSNVCKRLHLRALAKLFEYYQPPGISLRWSTDLND